MRDGDFTRLEIEAMLCAWEWINDITLSDAPMKDEAWIRLREGIGSIEMRMACIDIGLWVEQVYTKAVAIAGDGAFEAKAFDFEVIPAILSYLRNKDGNPYIHPPFPDVEATATAAVTAMKMQD